MRKWLNIIAVLGLLILLIPQTVDDSLVKRPMKMDSGQKKMRVTGTGIV